MTFLIQKKTKKKNKPIIIDFSSFVLQADSQLSMNEFLNSVGQLKYRGTSILFRSMTHAGDSIRINKRCVGLSDENRAERSW